MHNHHGFYPHPVHHLFSVMHSPFVPVVCTCQYLFNSSYCAATFACSVTTQTMSNFFFSIENKPVATHSWKQEHISTLLEPWASWLGAGLSALTCFQGESFRDKFNDILHRKYLVLTFRARPPWTLTTAWINVCVREGREEIQGKPQIK
jgi:hypothetical protein